MQTRKPFIEGVTKPQALNINILLCFVIISALIIFTCKIKDENKKADNIEKSLNLSLIFFPEMSPETPFSIDPSEIRRSPIVNSTPYSIVTNDSQIIYKKDSDTIAIIDNSDSAIIKNLIIYSIDIIKDSLIVISRGNYADKEYRGKLTDEQYLEVKKMVSTLNQTYDRSRNFAYDSWGCALKVDNQIYYQDNHFILEPCSKYCPPPIPEEIRLLISYILGLSPIPIEFGSFS